MDEQIFGWLGGLPHSPTKRKNLYLVPISTQVNFISGKKCLDRKVSGWNNNIEMPQEKSHFLQKKNYHLMKSVYLWWALFEHWEIDLSIFFAGSGIFLINGNMSKALVFITHKTKMFSRLEKENSIICYILKLLSTSCKDGELEQVTIFHIKNIML